VHRHTSSFMFVPFWMEFDDHWIGSDPFPGPFILYIWLLWVFYSGICKTLFFLWKSAKCEWVGWQSSELQSALPVKCLPIPGEKLNIILTCCATNAAHIRSIDHVSNFMKSSV
jgi:hypothetical protein